MASGTQNRGLSKAIGTRSFRQCLTTGGHLPSTWQRGRPPLLASRGRVAATVCLCVPIVDDRYAMMPRVCTCQCSCSTGAAPETAHGHSWFDAPDSPSHRCRRRGRDQVGNLVGPTSDAVTTVSTVDPIKANFTLSQQEISAWRGLMRSTMWSLNSSAQRGPCTGARGDSHWQIAKLTVAYIRWLHDRVRIQELKTRTSALQQLPLELRWLRGSKAIVGQCDASLERPYGRGSGLVQQDANVSFRFHAARWAEYLHNLCL